MHNRKILYLLPLALLLLLPLFLRKNGAETDTPPVSKPREVTRPLPPAVHLDALAEQQKWVSDTFIPAIERIKTAYPITTLRTAVNETFERIKRREIVLVMNTERQHQGAVAGGMHVKGERHLVFFVPVLEDVWRECGHREEVFDDYLVQTILHEEFHLLKQPPYKPGGLSRDELAIRESEAWWYTVEDVLLPMVRGKSSTVLDPVSALAVKHYQMANGDPENRLWQDFGKISTGLYPWPED